MKLHRIVALGLVAALAVALLPLSSASANNPAGGASSEKCKACKDRIATENGCIDLKDAAKGDEKCKKAQKEIDDKCSNDCDED